MKKMILSFFAVVFPFLVFFIIDLPGAGLVALGLQSTIVGWPVAIFWAFKHVFRVTEADKLKQAAAAAAAAARAAAEVQAEVDAETRKAAREARRVRSEE